MTNHDSLRDRLAEYDLSDLYGRAAATREPCVPFTSSEPAPVSVGASKLGGLPDLPPGTPWPRRGERPLMFLAQFNLADLPKPDSNPGLPVSGLLSFWYDTADEPWGYDPKHRGSFQVLYTDTPTQQLRRTDLPEFVRGDLDHDPHWDWKVFSECPIHTVEPFDYNLDRLKEELYDAGDAGDDESRDLAERLDDMLSEQTGLHRLLGWADTVQGEMTRECQLVSNGIDLGGHVPIDKARAEQLATGAPDWTLLLQLDTDEEGPGWMWGDCGRLYFWIRKQDLARADFSSIWGVLQSY